MIRAQGHRLFDQLVHIGGCSRFVTLSREVQQAAHEAAGPFGLFPNGVHDRVQLTLRKSFLHHFAVEQDRL